MAASKTFIYPSVGGTIIAVVFPSILLLALSSAVAGTALPPGPTHAWAFDEPAGTTAYPTFGSQEGQLVNGAGRSTDGPFSYADNHSVDLLDDQDQALFPSHYSGTSGSFQFWAYQSEMHGGDYYLHTTGRRCYGRSGPRRKRCGRLPQATRQHVESLRRRVGRIALHGQR